MPRIKMTDEERLAKKKERSRLSFSDAAYKNRYDASKGYGTPEDWMRAAEALVGGRLVLNIKTVSADLQLFGLDELPSEFTTLKSAFRKHVLKVHPDHGGTDEQLRHAVETFERLAKNY